MFVYFFKLDLIRLNYSPVFDLLIDGKSTQTQGNETQNFTNQLIEGAQACLSGNGQDAAFYDVRLYKIDRNVIYNQRKIRKYYIENQ